MSLLASLLVTLGISSSEQYASSKTIYDFSAKLNNGEEISLSEYRNKVVMIVNVASKCGFTKQYKDLQEIYTKYQDKGFVILGFPSNQFGEQEPGSDSEIKTFCEVNFGVTFPLFKKVDVKGDQKIPLFKFLTEEANSAHQGEVMWNFEKFLINRDGKLIERYRSITRPNSDKVEEKIRSLF